MHCSTCGQSVVTITGKLVEASILSKWTWNQVYSSRMGAEFVTDLGEFTKVGEKDVPDYDYAEQGHENHVFVVLERAGKYFMKEGMADSYGDIDWESGMKEVRAETKTVLEFKTW